MGKHGGRARDKTADDIAAASIRDSLASRLGSPRGPVPDPQELYDQEQLVTALRRVADLHVQLSELGEQLDLAVADARAAGAAWEAIGRAAGITQQAAWKRWARKIESTERS